MLEPCLEVEDEAVLEDGDGDQDLVGEELDHSMFQDEGDVDDDR
jgi:hypothetical protein